MGGYQDIQSKVQAELDSVVGEDPFIRLHYIFFYEWQNKIAKQ